MADKRSFLKKHEGQTGETYLDTAKIPTVGVGANLRQPEVQDIIRSMGKDPSQVKAGQESLAPSEQEELLTRQIQQREKELANIARREWPETELTPEQKTAILSLYYNSPKLIGPSLRGQLREGNIDEATKEILLRSNPKGLPGVQKRRVDEAKMMAGEEWSRVINEMAPEDVEAVVRRLQSIRNPHERARVIEASPQIMERFQKLKDMMKNE